MQLRSKIDGLGNLLLGMGAARRKVPWPTWFTEYSADYSLKAGGGKDFRDIVQGDPSGWCKPPVDLDWG